MLNLSRAPASGFSALQNPSELGWEPTFCPSRIMTTTQLQTDLCILPLFQLKMRQNLNPCSHPESVLSVQLKHN